ncbi:MAG: hypothetical protein LBP51_07665 [Deferribacteraceae bacterium]|jgi:hypothetical protein|nr:hypothetical protein [Deferribacteraceae bacterium]
MSRLSAFIALFIILSAVRVMGAPLFSEAEHNSVDYFSVTAGGGYSYTTPGGFADIHRRTVETPFWSIEVFSPDISNSERRTIFSTLKIVSTPYISIPNGSVAYGKKEDISSVAALELKTPFTFSFLGHNTPIYFGAEFNIFRFSSKVNAKIGAKGGFVFEKGDIICLTSYSERFYIGVNTPVVKGDAPISRSRFGVFYAQNTRPRYISFPDDADYHWIFTERDRYAGVFYKIVKPLFFKGFALGTDISLGFGFRELLESHGHSNKDLQNSRIYLYTDFGLSAAYQYNFSESIALNIYIVSNFMNSNLLQSKAEGAAYKNDGDIRVGAGLNLSIYY